MFRHMLLSAATALALFASYTAPSKAQEFDDIGSVIKVSFLQGWRHEDGVHFAGLKVDLAPGWKTYWRAPGDGGLPTLISWAGSDNVSDADIVWPRPRVFRQAGMRSVGYDTQVVLPLRFLPKTEGQMNVQLHLRMGVCKDVCLPVDMKLSTTLAQGAKEGVSLIKSALSDRPAKVAAPLTCRLTRKDGEYLLEVSTVVAQPLGRSEVSVIELPDPTIWVSEPFFARNGDMVVAKSRVIPQAKSAVIDLTQLRLTLLTTSDAIEMKGCG
ncbi:MAG: protein-disulfide reductase DsbD family protein [Litoreibacter sp.]|nr:protein-disulfide reductase DsbD family protein [Litoreibacter sp.]MCY4335535.1 protein-disulfide reductase DsbD family protein [Litoreibacter sp.]